MSRIRKPKGAADYSRSLVTGYSPNSAVAESYRMLRTNVLMSAGGDSPGVVMVTSAGRGEGKSVTCSNLGIVLSQADQRVVIVDADLRIPSQHSIFGLPARGSLGEALRNPTSREHVTKTMSRVSQNLDVITAAGFEPQLPSEVLGSTAFRDLLGVLREIADVVLVDSSPVGLVTDAAVLSRWCDSSIFVVSYWQNRRRFVERALSELQKANPRVLGTVLNRFPTAGRESGDGYLGGEYYRPSRALAGAGVDSAE